MTPFIRNICAVTLAALLLAGCGDGGAPDAAPASPVDAAQAEPAEAASEAAPAQPAQAERDRFTYANYTEVRVTHLDLDLTVDFEARSLFGEAALDIERVDPAADTLILDTKSLRINGVDIENAEGEIAPAQYGIRRGDAVLGNPLTVELAPDTVRVRVQYETTPESEGLQWLTPEQTAGKTAPYLFSQAQAINARTMAPLQDTPAVRMTYSATLTAPEGLTALMSAEQGGRGDDGRFRFRMPQAIPSYLLAIAIGDIAFKPINDHIGVYAEKSVLDAAAEEFSETPQMEAANAALYGPYRWGRYDLIVLPPSFPFGGMENPRLSFITPTLIAGDKSLTNVVAHELAHSWSGNLVTNATWRDAWLNEGVTSYVENRVIEALYGRRRAVMEQALSLADLKRDIAEASRPALTQLKLPEDLAHPDEAFSQVAYAKGQFFLTFLEQRYGRAAFDPFLKAYFDSHAFRSITTEDFLAFLEANLKAANPDAATREEIDAWVYGPGLPETFIPPVSDAFETVDAQSAAWRSGALALASMKTADWSTHEWLHFVNGVPADLDDDAFAALDAAFGFTATKNAEIAFAWYMQAIRRGYEPALPAIEAFLLEVGRGKYIYRLYAALAEHGRKDWAQSVFDRAGPGYHPIAQRRVGEILTAG